MEEKNKTQQISDDELWARVGRGENISRSDIGVDQPSRTDGLQSLNEGFNVLTYNNHNQNNSHDND